MVGVQEAAFGSLRQLLYSYRSAQKAYGRRWGKIWVYHRFQNLSFCDSTNLQLPYLCVFKNTTFRPPLKRLKIPAQATYLKGQCNEIFDFNLFSLKHSFWAPYELDKTVSRTFSCSQSYQITQFKIFVSAQSTSMRTAVSALSTTTRSLVFRKYLYCSMFGRSGFSFFLRYFYYINTYYTVTLTIFRFSHCGRFWNRSWDCSLVCYTKLATHLCNTVLLREIFCF